MKMFIGAVPQENGESIKTEFFIFVAPLFPISSMYVTRESASRSGNATIYRTSGVKVKMHWGSVLLGYLQWWLFYGMLASWLIPIWGKNISGGFDFSEPHWPWTFLLFGLWVAVVAAPHIAFRLRKDRLQIRALSSVTGVALHPRYLDEMARMQGPDSMAHRLQQAGVALTPEAIDTAHSEHSIRSLVFAYALYQSVGDPAWEPVVEASWRSLSG